jgi:hypothetical protein
MTNFAAQERTPAQPTPGVVPIKVPECDPEGLRELGATEYWPRRLEYLTRKHSMRDVIRPGYFCGEARARMHVGDEIFVTACNDSKVPSEWDRLILVVEEIPSTTAHPLIVSILLRFHKPTPVRHAGEALEME